MVKKQKSEIKNAALSVVIVSILTAGNSFINEAKHSIETLRRALVSLQIKEREVKTDSKLNAKEKAKQQLQVREERKIAKAKLSLSEEEKELIEELDSILENEYIEENIELFHGNHPDNQSFITEVEQTKNEVDADYDRIIRGLKKLTNKESNELIAGSLGKLYKKIEECEARIELNRTQKIQYTQKRDTMLPLINKVLALSDPSLREYQEYLRDFLFRLNDFIDSCDRYHAQLQNAKDELIARKIELGDL